MSGRKRPSWSGTTQWPTSEGAKSFGMKAVWKRDEYWDAPEVVDGVVRDLDELPGLIGEARVKYWVISGLGPLGRRGKSLGTDGANISVFGRQYGKGH